MWFKPPFSKTLSTNIRQYFLNLLKKTRNSSKIRPLDFPQNVPQNTNEHTWDYFRYVSLQIYEALFDFEG